MFLSNNYNNRKIPAPGSILYKHNIRRCFVGYENHNALYLAEIATRKLNSPATKARLFAWGQNCARHTDSSVKTSVAEFPWRSSVLITCLPMHETQVWSLDGEDSLEEVMATHSSILAWRIPRTEGPGGRQSMRSQTVRQEWVTEQHSCLTMPAVCILSNISCTNPSKKDAPFLVTSTGSPFIWF